jgi:hypothetical protein
MVGLPGVEEYSGRKCDGVTERYAGMDLSRRGLIDGKGKMVIFRML